MEPTELPKSLDPPATDAETAAALVAWNAQASPGAVSFHYAQRAWFIGFIAALRLTKP